MSREISINFTRSDLDDMLTMIEKSEEATEGEDRLTVFDWVFGGIDVNITVGPDE